MDKIGFKERFRRALHFTYTVFVTGNVRFLFYLLRIGGLGVLSSFVENSFLYECARSCEPDEGAVVEIGSFKGRTTLALAYGLAQKKGGHVYAIDPQDNKEVKEAFIKNIKGAKTKHCIVPVFKRSEDAVKDFHVPIRLLFIDGCHEYEEVKKDILIWKGLVAPGGVIALHDYLPKTSPAFLEGVKRAVDECIIPDPDFVVEGTIDSVLFISKTHTLEKNKRIFSRYNRFEKMRMVLKSKLDKSFLKYGEGYV